MSSKDRKLSRRRIEALKKSKNSKVSLIDRIRQVMRDKQKAKRRKGWAFLATGVPVLRRDSGKPSAEMPV